MMTSECLRLPADRLFILNFKYKKSFDAGQAQESQVLNAAWHISLTCPTHITLLRVQIICLPFLLLSCPEQAAERGGF